MDNRSDHSTSPTPRSGTPRSVRLPDVLQDPSGRPASCRPLFNAVLLGRRRRSLAALCLVLGIALLGSRCYSASTDRLIAAIHQVETSGRLGPIKGDGGRALGPLQIHRAYWIDSRVPGRYEDVARLDYAKRVFLAYMRRYCPEALASGDFETIARIHNGGPRGRHKQATLGYWRAVNRHLQRKTSK